MMCNLAFLEKLYYIMSLVNDRMKIILKKSKMNSNFRILKFSKIKKCSLLFSFHLAIFKKKICQSLNHKNFRNIFSHNKIIPKP